MRSRAQLAAELNAKRVPREDAAAAMSGHSDARVAAAIAARKPALSNAALRKHLTWKGFGFGTIDAVLEARRRGADELT